MHVVLVANGQQQSEDRRKVDILPISPIIFDLSTFYHWTALELSKDISHSVLLCFLRILRTFFWRSCSDESVKNLKTLLKVGHFVNLRERPTFENWPWARFAPGLYVLRPFL
jgi:hypothetical protein